MAFDADGLRRAGQRQRDTADEATVLARHVGAIAPTPQMFGTVRAAAAFSSAVRAARDVQTRGVVGEVDRRDGLAGVADHAADQAAALTLETENTAKLGTN